jgi:hypothetical protein
VKSRDLVRVWKSQDLVSLVTRIPGFVLHPPHAAGIIVGVRLVWEDAVGVSCLRCRGMR